MLCCSGMATFSSQNHTTVHLTSYMSSRTGQTHVCFSKSLYLIRLHNLKKWEIIPLPVITKTFTACRELILNEMTQPNTKHPPCLPVPKHLCCMVSMWAHLSHTCTPRLSSISYLHLLQKTAGQHNQWQ